MKMPTLKSGRAQLALIGVIVLAVYVVLPQVDSLSSSWQVLGDIDLKKALLGVFFTALTYLAAAATYGLLAFKPLPYWRTVEVQLAAMFVNRLLPAGLGAIGTSYAYLRHMKHTTGQAAGVVAVNNLLGMVGHGLLTVFVLAAAGDDIRLPASHHVTQNAIKLAGVMIFIGLAISIVISRRKWRLKLAGVEQQLLSYRERPGRLIAATASSMALTACNVLCLWAAATAAGLHLPLAALFIVFTFGVSLGTATPTPGGLGGFEAGLFAGMVAYGIPAGPALAVALLYRLISYWLVMAVGALAFTVSQRQGLFART